MHVRGSMSPEVLERRRRARERDQALLELARRVTLSAATIVAHSPERPQRVRKMGHRGNTR